MTFRPVGAPRDRRTGRFVRYKGHKVRRRGKKWWNWAEEQKNWVGRICERCGVDEVEGGGLEVHHLWPLSEGGPLFPDDPGCPETGVRVLCKRCHLRERAPVQVREWMDLVDELWE